MSAACETHLAQITFAARSNSPEPAKDRFSAAAHYHIAVSPPFDHTPPYPSELIVRVGRFWVASRSSIARKLRLWNVRQEPRGSEHLLHH
jgi:hypothetical protein